MRWTESEIDELLVRYLDRELSSEELSRFDALLDQSPDVRQKLLAWQKLRQALRELPSESNAPPTLGPRFAERILDAARRRVTEAGDVQLAPWIERNQPQPEATVESFDRMRARDLDPDRIDGKVLERKRAWWKRVAVLGIAASILAMAFWNWPNPVANSLLSKHVPPATTQVPDSVEDAPSSSLASDVPAAADRLAQTDELPLPRTSSATDLKAMASGDATASGNRRAASSPASPGLLPSRDIVASNAVPSVEPNVESSVALSPSAEQLKIFQDMATNPNGAFLFVIDVSLPDETDNLDSLRKVLDFYDIAWASQLEIDERTQSNLAQSRMIADAGRSGLLPDFVETQSKNEVANNPDVPTASRELASLIFVKARGKRLDSALIELMQRTDEFPAFSFDLAFDPPTQELMNELRFIQEASLPEVTTPSSQDSSSAVRLARKPNAGTSAAYFAAGPRRSPPMSIETRRQSRLPLTAEMMNPVTYALFIVRHSATVRPQ